MTRQSGSEQTIGVLALQGDFEAHAEALARCGARPTQIRRPQQLDEIDGLVIPGGESTALIRLMDYEPRWWTALPALHRRRAPILGICAGLILVASRVKPRQRSLAMLDICAQRNGYGRQIDSFETIGSWSETSIRPGAPIEMVFIRAPRIVELGQEIEVLATAAGEPVLVRQGSVLGASFHPELSGDVNVFDALLQLARDRCNGPRAQVAGSPTP